MKIAIALVIAGLTLAACAHGKTILNLSGLPSVVTVS